MSSIFKKCITGLAAFATLAMVASPAEARHRDRDDDALWAIGAGIVGLGIIGALASSSRNRYYDPYYRDRYYDYGYYDRPYYRQRYRYSYRDRCYTRRVWDPYWGRTVRVRYCD